MPLPRRQVRGTWRRVLAISVAVVAGVLVLLGIIGAVAGNPDGSIVPQTSRSSFYKKIDQFAQKQLTLPGLSTSRIASTSCAFPKKWTVGESFDCFVYDHSKTELGKVTVTVLTTSPGDAWNANFLWTPSFP